MNQKENLFSDQETLVWQRKVKKKQTRDVFDEYLPKIILMMNVWKWQTRKMCKKVKLKIIRNSTIIFVNLYTTPCNVGQKRSNKFKLTLTLI